MPLIQEFKYALLFKEGTKKARPVGGQFITKKEVDATDGSHAGYGNLYVGTNLLVVTVIEDSDPNLQNGTYTVTDNTKIYPVIVVLDDENEVKIGANFPIGTQFTPAHEPLYACGNWNLILSTDAPNG